MSGRLTPAAATRIRISPSRGSGRGRSTRVSASGPPGVGATTARIVDGNSVMTRSLSCIYGPCRSRPSNSQSAGAVTPSIGGAARNAGNCFRACAEGGEPGIDRGVDEVRQHPLDEAQGAGDGDVGGADPGLADPTRGGRFAIERLQSLRQLSDDAGDPRLASLFRTCAERARNGTAPPSRIPSGRGPSRGTPATSPA